MPVKVMDLDLCRIWTDISVPNGYGSVHALIRWCGRPIGRINVRASGGIISCSELWNVAWAELGWKLRTEVLNMVAFTGTEPVRRKPILTKTRTVVICTRDRADDLRRCLASLCSIDDRRCAITVVDNAPTNKNTAEVVGSFPVQYIVEDRKGLNWARTRGIHSSETDIVIFCDDDVVVDPDWIDFICQPFEDEAVGIVTGLVMPFELETPAQLLFEHLGGFSRGFTHRYCSSANLSSGAVGRMGAGASMAVRTEVARRLRLFETELDAGTPAMTGGDNYAMYRVLTSGYTLVYNPDAVSWHRHRRSFSELRNQLYANNVGVFCFAFQCLHLHRDMAPLLTALQWVLHDHIRSALRSAFRRHAEVYPFRLTQLLGVLAAPWAYVRARMNNRRYSMPARS